jgi:hypothetical protein
MRFTPLILSFYSKVVALCYTQIFSVGKLHTITAIKSSFLTFGNRQFILKVLVEYLDVIQLISNIIPNLG